MHAPKNLIMQKGERERDGRSVRPTLTRRNLGECQADDLVGHYCPVDQQHWSARGSNLLITVFCGFAVFIMTPVRRREEMLTCLINSFLDSSAVCQSVVPFYTLVVLKSTRVEKSTSRSFLMKIQLQSSLEFVLLLVYGGMRTGISVQQSSSSLQIFCSKHTYG